MTKTVTIHQPQYLPWIPYFAKILAADEFIFLDNVAFQKNGVQNRNQIKTPNGRIWLTVPVKQSLGQKINETVIANPKQLEKHMKAIAINYKKAPYYDEVYSLLSDNLKTSTTDLAGLNIQLTRTILDYLGFQGKTVIASDIYQGDEINSVLIRRLCQLSDADIYLSGHGGKNYMDLDDFTANKIKVLFHNYQVKPYQQLYPKLEFMSDLSIIDLLFNNGKASAEIIQQGQLPCEQF